MPDAPEKIDPEGRPPIPLISSWPRAYLVVLLHLALWLIMLAAFTAFYEPTL